MKHRLCLPELTELEELGPGTQMTLSREHAHYLGRVLRLKTGAEIGLFDGVGNEWSAELTMLEGRVKAHEHGLTVIGVDGIDFRSLDEAGVGSDVTLAIRPEDIIVSKGPLQQVSVQNRIEALLEDIVPEGKISLLRLKAHDMPLSVLVTRNALHQLQLAPGDTVWANIKSANVRIVRDPIGAGGDPVRA